MRLAKRCSSRFQSNHQRGYFFRNRIIAPPEEQEADAGDGDRHRRPPTSRRGREADDGAEQHGDRDHGEEAEGC